MIQNLNEVSSMLGISEDSLKEMIASEESHTIDLSQKVILDKLIYDERIENIKKETVKTAFEIAVKEQRNLLGLDFQGKTIENLVTALKAKVESESKAEPEEKYKNLKEDFEKVQKNLQDKETEFNTFKTNIENQNTLSEIKNDFTKHIPDNVIVSKSTIFTEAKEKGFSFEREEGKTVIKDLSGNILKDPNTLSPLGLENWVKDFATPYLGKASGGGGGKDDKSNAPAGSFEAFEKEASKNGWTDAEKNSEMAKRMSDGTLKL